MILNAKDIRENRQRWLSKGYELPQYDRDDMIQKSRKDPVWIHFGAGNIFRAFQCNALQKVLNAGEYDRGVIAAGGRDSSIIDRMYRLHDDLSVLVTLHASGQIDKTVIGSVSESVTMDFHNEEDHRRLTEIFEADSLQMASFTVTEKGYATKDPEGNILPDIAEDFTAGPSDPKSYMGRFVSLLYVRYLSGCKKIAVVSMDNCHHNGDLLKAAVLAFAENWEKNGKVEKKGDLSFSGYISDKKLVSFPCSMIDKITPRPDKQIEDLLEKDGIEDIAPVITPRKTYVAPYVNAEVAEYLVIEDDFPNGRPPLEKGGVIFTDRETVNRCERMKVATCLNPLHTSLAVFGCVLGYKKMSDAIADPDLKKLVEGVGYKEGLPVVTNPGILDPKKFIDTVVNERIPNPFLPDTPQRIATDTSQKLPVRFGGTIQEYMKTEMGAQDLVYIPLVFAGWLRYLMGVDDEGNAFERSSDPLLPEVTPFVADFKLGEKVTAEEADKKLHDLLANETIFGADLYQAGLSGKVVADFVEMIAGKGAVRAALHNIVG